MMILPAVLLLLLSLVSLGTLAVTNEKFTDKFNYRGTLCVLYTGTKDNTLKPNDGGECTYSIVAVGILGFLALVLVGVFVTKAIIGIAV